MSWDLVIRDVDAPIPLVSGRRYLIMGTTASSLTDPDLSSRLQSKSFRVSSVSNKPPSLVLPKPIQDAVSSFLSVWDGLDDDARDLLGRPVFVDAVWTGSTHTYDSDDFYETFSVRARGVLTEVNETSVTSFHPFPWIFPALAVGTLFLLLFRSTRR